MSADCPTTGRLMYRTRYAAERAAERLARRGQRRRIVRCKSCGTFHLERER